MKTKTVKSVLRKKVNDWLSHIDDEAVRKLAAKNTLVTGGSIASMLLGEKISDFDLYFKNKETVLAIANYYVKKFKENPPPSFKGGADIPISVIEENGRVKIVIQSAGIASESDAGGYQYFETLSGQEYAGAYVEDASAALNTENEEGEKKPKYRPVFMSSNAITLSNDIQLVIRFYGEANEIHKNYDFVHCTCSWDADSGELMLPQRALECLLSKDLQYIGGSKYPLCSIIRTRKFLSRDWRINAGQYVKMAWDLNELDLSDIDVLEDQMVGVDAAYFLEVLNRLKEKTDGKKIDGTYLMEVIDMIF